MDEMLRAMVAQSKEISRKTRCSRRSRGKIFRRERYEPMCILNGERYLPSADSKLETQFLV
jgi:hypothetical protein